jgi:hypothetical protein
VLLPRLRCLPAPPAPCLDGVGTPPVPWPQLRSDGGDPRCCARRGIDSPARPVSPVTGAPRPRNYDQCHACDDRHPLQVRNRSDTGPWRHARPVRLRDRLECPADHQEHRRLQLDHGRRGAPTRSLTRPTLAVGSAGGRVGRPSLAFLLHHPRSRLWVIADRGGRSRSAGAGASGSHCRGGPHPRRGAPG